MADHESEHKVRLGEVSYGGGRELTVEVHELGAADGCDPVSLRMPIGVEALATFMPDPTCVQPLPALRLSIRLELWEDRGPAPEPSTPTRAEPGSDS